MYYYGFRLYSTELGRWLNRDPVNETGGTGLYIFVVNDPQNRVDLMGLKDFNIWGLYSNSFIMHTDIHRMLEGKEPIGALKDFKFNPANDRIVFDNPASQTTDSVVFLGKLIIGGLIREGCYEAAEHFSYWLDPKSMQQQPNLKPSFFTDKLPDDVQAVRDEILAKGCRDSNGTLSFRTKGRGPCIFLLLGNYPIAYKAVATGNNTLKVTFTVKDPYDFTKLAKAEKKVGNLRIVIMDEVWLNLNRRNEGYGINYKRSCSWTEEIKCCPVTSNGSKAQKGNGNEKRD